MLNEVLLRGFILFACTVNWSHLWPKCCLCSRGEEALEAGGCKPMLIWDHGDNYRIKKTIPQGCLEKGRGCNGSELLFGGARATRQRVGPWGTVSNTGVSGCLMVKTGRMTKRTQHMRSLLGLWVCVYVGSESRLKYGECQRLIADYKYSKSEI